MTCPACGGNCRAPQKKVDELMSELSEWRKARRALATGAKSYSIGDRSLTRASLSDIRGAIKDIEDELHNWCRYGCPFPPRGARVMRGVYVDNR